MSRRIIIVEDFFDEAGTEVEAVIEQLQDKGLKAYLASTVFTTEKAVPDQLASLLELNSNSEEQSVVSTLLAQKTLLENELRKYRTLIENSGDIMYAMDFAGNLTFLSNNIHDFLGYRADELIGQNFLKVIAPAQHQRAVERFERQKTNSVRGPFLTDMLTKDGKIVPVEINGRNYFENNVAVLNVGLIRDISVRKQMQAEVLRRNRELTALYSIASVLNQSLDLGDLLKNCLDRMMDAVAVTTGGMMMLDRNGEPRISAENGFDAEFSELFYAVLRDLGDLPKSLARGEFIVYTDLTKLPLNPEVAKRMEYKFVVIGPLMAKDRALGGFILADKDRAQLSPEDRDLLMSIGRQVGMALQTADLYAALNETVDELRKTNVQLEEATRHKSEFLAVMSHELRTPLNAIIGFSELLQDQTFGPLNPKQTRYVENIHSSGKHLLALVNDVLDLAKVEAGKMELQYAPLSVRELINEVFNNVGSLALKKQISLSTPARQPDVTIMADRGRFKQVLYNLLSNALKFTPEGGQVSVQVKRPVKNGIEWVNISVVDNGIGIKKEDQERIFEEFQMVDSTLAKKQQGTGLGLALSRRLAQLHGGNITLESEVGKGSTFSFSMPLDPVKAKQLTTANAEQILEAYRRPEIKTEKLALVIEDEDQSAELLQLYMEQSGYQVVRCSNGEKALQMAKEIQPTVITLDVVLPQKNGWEVLRELKEDPATRDIPVMIVSMLDNNDSGFALGAVAYFVKPVERADLLAKLREIELGSLSGKRRANFEEHRKSGKSLQVVVVDDNQDDQEFLTAVLQSAGMNIRVASNGEEGWQLIEKTPPDLVVLDLMMPGADGFDVLKRLRQNPVTADIPVFIYTAKELNATERDRLKTAEGVLLKGALTRERFLEAVGFFNQK